MQHRVVLVQPPVDKRFSSLNMTFKRLAPPLGLSILACETERRLEKDLNIKVYCPDSISEEFIHTCTECDILGISTWFSNYENGLALARIAKKANPEILVIFGGTNATNLGKRVLLNRPEVDLVVCGDGEDVLWRIIEGQNYSSIPNLWYRDESNAYNFTKTEHVDINSLGIWDFRHSIEMKLEDYDSQLSNYKFNPELPPIGLSMTRGCMKATKQCKRCDYCSIPVGNFRGTKQEKVWMQVQHLYELYGIESYFETGDDFTHVEYARKLSKIKPSNLPFRLRIYASPWSLIDECVGVLSELGVYEVFVGLETIDKDISYRTGHISTKNNVIDALERLKNADLSVCLPFLFGLPGETPSSLWNNVDFANELVERYSNIRMVLISLAIPLIGSQWFNRLSSNRTVCETYNKLGGNLETDDVLNYYHLLEFSLKQEGAVSIGKLVEALEAMRKHLEHRVVVGCFGGIEIME